MNQLLSRSKFRTSTMTGQVAPSLMKFRRLKCLPLCQRGEKSADMPTLAASTTAPCISSRPPKAIIVSRLLRILAVPRTQILAQFRLRKRRDLPRQSNMKAVSKTVNKWWKAAKIFICSTSHREKRPRYVKLISALPRTLSVPSTGGKEYL